MNYRRRSHRRRPPRTSAFVMSMVTQVPKRESWGEPLLLPLDEVAHRLSISRTTLWRLLKEGELDAVHIGSRTFVLAASIDTFIERHTAR